MQDGVFDRAQIGQSHFNYAVYPKRSNLMLALDATRLPVLGFEDVVEEFQARFGTWIKSLGFEAVWLVGPQDSLTWRLDNAA